jgi:hypothetical protein
MWCQGVIVMMNVVKMLVNVLDGGAASTRRLPNTEQRLVTMTRVHDVEGRAVVRVRLYTDYLNGPLLGVVA